MAEEPMRNGLIVEIDGHLFTSHPMIYFVCFESGMEVVVFRWTIGLFFITDLNVQLTN